MVNCSHDISTGPFVTCQLHQWQMWASNHSADEQLWMSRLSASGTETRWWPSPLGGFRFRTALSRGLLVVPSFGLAAKAPYRKAVKSKDPGAGDTQEHAKESRQTVTKQWYSFGNCVALVLCSTGEQL
eukprot:7385267-Prymnesium_polylepis.1